MAQQNRQKHQQAKNVPEKGQLKRVKFLGYMPHHGVHGGEKNCRHRHENNAAQGGRQVFPTRRQGGYAAHSRVMNSQIMTMPLLYM